MCVFDKINKVKGFEFSEGKLPEYAETRHITEFGVVKSSCAQHLYTSFRSVWAILSLRYNTDVTKYQLAVD